MQSLYEAGKIYDAVREMKKVDILGISEMRWPCQLWQMSDRRLYVYYSGNEDQYFNGIDNGIIMS